MLFEREPLTAQGKETVLARLFADYATNAEGVAPGTVPREVLEAYGDLSMHVRFMIQAASHVKLNKETGKLIRKIEKLLDNLPENILQSLIVGPHSNWMLLYRKLVQLHVMLEDALPVPDSEEFEAIVQKLVRLAETVAKHACVKINPASMFTLLLMQVHLHKSSPKKSKSPRSRQPRKSAGKKKSNRAESA